MHVHSLLRADKVVEVRPEDLAGDANLTPRQKIAEASRQFEAVLLRQILSEMQKPVVTSEFTDNSTASNIYQEMVTDTLADDISKSGSFGLAKMFERQLTPPQAVEVKSGRTPASQTDSPPDQPAGRLNFAPTKPS